MIICQGHVEPFKFMADKTKVKPCIVGNKDAVFYEGVECGDYVVGLGLADEHGIGDPVYPLNGLGDRAFYVDKGMKLFRDPSVLNGYGPYLYYPRAIPWRKACCLHINDYVPLEPGHFRFVNRRSFHSAILQPCIR